MAVPFIHLALCTRFNISAVPGPDSKNQLLLSSLLLEIASN